MEEVSTPEESDKSDKHTSTAKHRILLASILGTGLEFYEFSIYGFLAPTLTTVFFPTQDSYWGLFLSLSIFALGSTMRPFGGLLLGHIGDYYGRKRALIWAILGMSLSTGLIGLLPTPVHIGGWAALLLAFCRLCQGLCVGGEYNGAAIFVLECAGARHPAILSSFVTCASVVGALLGLQTSLHLMELPPLPFEGWRLPFMVSSLIGMGGYYLRRQLPEAPRPAAEPPPLRILLKTYRSPLLMIFGIGSLCGAGYYTLLVFMNTFLTALMDYPRPLVWKALSALLVLKIALLPCFAWLSERMGEERFMKRVTLMGAFISLPIFALLGSQRWEVACWGLMLLTLLTAAYVAPVHVILCRLLPASCRYRGIALGFGLGMSIVGSFVPLFYLTLLGWTNWPLSPGVVMTGLYVVGFYMMISMEKIKLQA